MTRVTVQPGDLALEVADDESVAEAAWRQGWRWPTTCWGKAECTVCSVLVLDGEQAVLPADDEEIDAIDLRMPLHLRLPGTRLACRLRLRGDGAVVEKKGVRPPAGTN